jgi:glycosyltransferase involved in cell wall biosynthesis
MDPGGVEIWLLHLLKQMDLDRFRFHFSTFGSRPGLFATEIEKLGAKVLPCPKGKKPWLFAHRFKRILRDGKYDVVHSHVHFFSGAILRWAKAESVPMRIAHSHTSQDDRTDTWARRFYRTVMVSWIHRYATHGLAASKLAAAPLFGENWQAETCFRVLHCGIDLQPFEMPSVREEVRRELGLPISAPVVGHVGHFVPSKNHWFFLDLAGAVLKRRPETHFLLIGDGPLRPEIESRARTMGLFDKMHFVGTRRDVPRLMRGAMDVLVFPSLWEGLPITLVEAQAAGLCCIFSDTVTNEATILSGQMIPLPLSIGPNQWAAQTVDALGRPRVQDNLALRTIARTDFCIQRSSLFLSALYSTARE